MKSDREEGGNEKKKKREAGTWRGRERDRWEEGNEVDVERGETGAKVPPKKKQNTKRDEMKSRRTEECRGWTGIQFN